MPLWATALALTCALFGGPVPSRGAAEEQCGASEEADAIEISLAAFQAGGREERAAIASDLDRAMRTLGFFYLADHGVPEATTEALLGAASAFFTRDLGEKMRFASDGPGQAGYTPAGGERQEESRTAAAGAEGGEGRASARVADLVEHFYYPMEAGADSASSAAMARSVPAEFMEDMLLYNFTQHMVRAVRGVHAIASEALGADFEAFYDAEHGNLYHLRCNHYFALPLTDFPDDRIADAYRLGAHADYVGFTLLAGEAVAGLQVYLPEERKWVGLATRPGRLVVNAGLFVSQVTNGQWLASTHRVAVVSREARRSVVFFTGPPSGAIIAPLPGCQICNAEPFKYQPLTVEAFVAQAFARATTGPGQA